MSDTIIELISRSLSLDRKQVSATAELLNDGGTIPFISRYRKEATGGLDETKVAEIQSELKRLNDLVKRRDYILKSISDQEKLTDELEAKINNCWNLDELEDIYLPFKPKRKTRATAAREKGLEPLADLMMLQENIDLNDEASKFLNDEVGSIEEALAGARDIAAEWISENGSARNAIRELFRNSAVLSSKVVTKKKDEGQKYLDYFDFSEDLRKCPGHRLLAILRAEQEGILRVSVSVDAGSAAARLRKIFMKDNVSNACTEQIDLAISDSLKRLLLPSIETEFRNSAKAKADKEAIRVFAENLRQLLLAAPLGQKATLAIDPGFRTGCKVVCLDDQGFLKHHTTIYPHPPQNQAESSAKTIRELIERFRIQAIAVGNGTAGRETASFIKYAIDGIADIEVYVVNESGASIYSASETAREEFPDLDLTVRGAISIGRRLMDPLAELVKIDPKSIGVGQYQHDVDQDELKYGLDQVASFAVNQVGVNLNTSSKHLLQYVSGIGPKLAKAITRYRQDNGPFKSRKELMKVAGLGSKVFEQSAGFLRIPGAENPLDNSAVHPESYSIVDSIAKDLSKPVNELIGSEEIRKQIDIKKYVNDKVGLPTLEDILKELLKPGLDPRGKAEAFSFSENVNELSNIANKLKEGKNEKPNY
jgi:uncharacterized protein